MDFTLIAGAEEMNVSTWRTARSTPELTVSLSTHLTWLVVCISCVRLFPENIQLLFSKVLTEKSANSQNLLNSMLKD